MLANIKRIFPAYADRSSGNGQLLVVYTVSMFALGVQCTCERRDKKEKTLIVRKLER